MLFGSAREALAVKDFRRYWLANILSRLGSSMQTMAIAWQIYSITHEPFSLGLIGLVQAGPVMMFTLLGGAWADAMSRRKLLFVSQTLLLLLSALLAVFAGSGITIVWPLYAVLFVAAIVHSAEGPAHSAIIPALVPPPLMPSAISVNNLAWSMAGILGPALGGLILARGGLATVYALDAVSFLAVMTALWRAHADLDTVAAAHTKGFGQAIAAIKEGFTYMRQHPVMLHLIVLDFFAVIFGEARYLLPVFAMDVLHVGAEGMGLLGSATAVGAVVGTLITAALPPLQRPGRVVVLSVLAYGAATFAFGYSTVFWLSWLALLAVGVADTISMTQRQIIPQVLSTDEVRGRVGGINLFFAATGNQLGEVEAGFVAQALGARTCVMFGGAVCMALALSVAIKSRAIWRFVTPQAREV